MGYFIAILMFLGGFPFIFTARKSANNVKDIRKLLEDDKNRQEAKGSLQVIEIRSSRHSFECDVKLVFTNHNGKIFRYEESFSGFDSKASFLWKCENKGEVPVTVIYDKSFPSKTWPPRAHCTPGLGTVQSVLTNSLWPTETNWNTIRWLRTLPGHAASCCGSGTSPCCTLPETPAATTRWCCRRGSRPACTTCRTAEAGRHCRFVHNIHIPSAPTA